MGAPKAIVAWQHRCRPFAVREKAAGGMASDVRGWQSGAWRAAAARIMEACHQNLSIPRSEYRAVVR